MLSHRHVAQKQNKTTHGIALNLDVTDTSRHTIYQQLAHIIAAGSV